METATTFPERKYVFGLWKNSSPEIRKATMFAWGMMLEGCHRELEEVHREIVSPAHDIGKIVKRLASVFHEAQTFPPDDFPEYAESQRDLEPKFTFLFFDLLRNTSTF